VRHHGDWLGAKRVLGTGVSVGPQTEAADDTEPSLAQVLGVLFNVMFLDNLDTDVEPLDRLNKLTREGQIQQTAMEGCERMRRLATFLITPSAGGR